MIKSATKRTIYRADEYFPGGIAPALCRPYVFISSCPDIDLYVTVSCLDCGSWGVTSGAVDQLEAFQAERNEYET
jgi:hypothetical protein